MYYFIVNPSSRSGQGIQVWRQVKTILSQRRLSYKAYFTKYTGHGTQIARRIAPLAAEHSLIIIGGDGTINEVLNGLPENSRITLGYLPVGSGNDFARGVHLPSDPIEVLEKILFGQPPEKLDLGQLRTQKRISHFAISSGIGYDAEVCYEVAHTRMKTVLNALHLGKLTYAYAAVKLLFSFHPFDADIRLDGGRSYHFSNVYFIAGMNLQYEGGGFRFCPQANSHDGALDYLVVQGLPKWKILLLFPTAYFARHTRIRGIHILRGTQMQIHTGTPQRLHRDGEYAGKNNAACMSARKQLLDFYY